MKKLINMFVNPSQTYANFHSLKDVLGKKESNIKLSIISLNIRSLRKNFDSLLASLSSIINFIDVIILTETNITEDENTYYRIEGYNAEYYNRKGRRGGGIAVYIKKKR